MAPQVLSMVCLDFAQCERIWIWAQDIPKNNDRAASRMFWTWRAHQPSAVQQLRDHLMKGVLNVRLRLEHETLQCHEVILCATTAAAASLLTHEPL